MPKLSINCSEVVAVVAAAAVMVLILLLATTVVLVLVLSLVLSTKTGISSLWVTVMSASATNIGSVDDHHAAS